MGTRGNPVTHFGKRTISESEYGWGTGLTPPGYEDAPPSEGGRYSALTPPVPIDPGLQELMDEIAEHDG